MPYFEYLGFNISLVPIELVSSKYSNWSKSWHQTHSTQVCSNQSQLVMDTKHPVTELWGGAQIGFYLSACTNHSLGKEPHYLSCSFLCPPESLTIVSQELLSASQHTQISSWSTSGFEPTYGQSFVSSISYDSANIIYIWDLLGKISFIWIK